MCDRGTSNEDEQFLLPEGAEVNVRERARGHSNEDQTIILTSKTKSKESGGDGDRKLSVRCKEESPTLNKSDSGATIYSCDAPDPLVVEDGSDLVVPVTVSDVEVQLDYQIHTTTDADVDAELLTLQADMLAYLANEFALGLTDCTGYDVSQQPDRALRPLTRRRLEMIQEHDSDVTKIISISSLRSDSADPNNDCLPQLDPDIPSTDCTAINGRWTATYIGTDEAAVNRAIAQTIQTGMNNDQFISKNIANVAFIGTRTTPTQESPAITTNNDKENIIINDSIKSRTDNNTNTTKANSVGGMGAGLISAFVVAAAAIAAFFIHRKKKRKDRAMREDAEFMLEAHQDKSLCFDLEGVPTDSSEDEDATTDDAADWKTPSISEQHSEELEDNPHHVGVASIQHASTTINGNTTKAELPSPTPATLESIKNAKLPVINEDGRDLLRQSLSLKDSPTKAETLMRTQGYLLERISSTESASSITSSSSSSQQPRRVRSSSSLLHGVEGEVEILDENVTEI